VSQLGLLGLAVAVVGALVWFLGGRLADSYQATIQARMQAEESRAAVERAIRSRDEYFAAASHDLRNPLTAILGAAQLLSRRLAEVDLPDADRLRHRAGIIESAANRMARLIAGLLDLARLEGGRPLDLDLAPTDLATLTSRVVAETQHAHDRYPIHLAADGALLGEWDASRLERAIVNLLDNAVKYSPDGGEVQVSIRRDERDGKPCAVLTVQDRGMGIPPEDLPHIFDQFRRGSNVVGQVRGTGLGLAGVRQIVAEHGGTVEVESEVGVGTKVTIALPTEQAVEPGIVGEGDRGPNAA
jgi:signal transduction histidine kinase